MLSAGCTSNEQPTRTPQAAQERSLHEVSDGDEDVTLIGTGLHEQRVQCFTKELRLSRHVLRNGFLRR